jgi:putative membrane protein
MTVLDPRERFDIQPSANNHFAWIRTRLALERSYLAWIRTAISLIGFGFTIVQFFQRMQGMPTINGRVMSQAMPREFGLALIGTGVMALAISSWQYHSEIRYLNSAPFAVIAVDSERAGVLRTPAFIAAMVILLIGVAAFVGVFLRFM